MSKVNYDQLVLLLRIVGTIVFCIALNYTNIKTLNRKKIIFFAAIMIAFGLLIAYLKSL